MPQFLMPATYNFLQILLNFKPGMLEPPYLGCYAAVTLLWLQAILRTSLLIAMGRGRFLGGSQGFQGKQSLLTEFRGAYRKLTAN